jgi:hypothetical protein
VKLVLTLKYRKEKEGKRVLASPKGRLVSTNLNDPVI